MPVWYPAALKVSANVVSLRGRPPSDPREKFLTTPVRFPSLPVRRAARDGVQTDAPAWKSVNLVEGKKQIECEDAKTS